MQELKDENKQLEVGLREILAQLREHAQKGLLIHYDVHVRHLPSDGPSCSVLSTFFDYYACLQSLGDS